GKVDANVEGAASLTERFARRQEAASRYIDAYRRYCWQGKLVKDFRLAPFYFFATESHGHANREHSLDMGTLARIFKASGWVVDRYSVPKSRRDRSSGCRRRHSMVGRIDGTRR